MRAARATRPPAARRGLPYRVWDAITPAMALIVEARRPIAADLEWSAKLKLAQGRQQASGSFQIRRIQVLSELLDNRLQKRSGALGPALRGPQRGQVDGGTQLPCPRALTTAQLKRLREALLCVLTVGLRH